MADVWISRKRWTCKYCDVTINDDLPSRRHHESGVRHKQNVQKALQDLYRKGEQERKDAEHLKKEMARIEALAAESYAKDQASAEHSATTSSSLTSSSPTTSAALPSSSRTNPISGSARPKSKTTTAPNQELVQPVAQAGEWESVESEHPSQPAASSSTSHASDRDKARSFRMKEKAARLDDSDDDQATDEIKIKKRPRTDAAEAQNESRTPSGVKKEDAAVLDGTLKRESGPVASTSQPRPDANATESAKPKAEKEEEDGGNGATGGLFKKRRAGAGAGAKRVRAVI